MLNFAQKMALSNKLSNKKVKIIEKNLLFYKKLNAFYIEI